MHSPANERRFLLLFPAVLLFFFVSGGCGLLYQVVWTRKLVLLFGTTSYAVSTVLSIFFLGLGLGSLWGGRLADKKKAPLYLYGVFEFIIGLWALLFIVFVSYGEGVVVSILKTFDFSHFTGILLRAVLAMVFLLVPVLLMGATLPLLSKFVTREVRVRGMRIGALYTLNTFGAVAGCFITGFFLIANFGYTQTTFIGAAANGLVGILAIAMSKGMKENVTKVQDNTSPEKEKLAVDEPQESASDEPLPQLALVLVLMAFALSGFTFLALEVLWTRLLAMVFLGTTYAYTTMLTALLCGIGIGSGVASALVDRLRKPMFVLGVVMTLSGVGSLWTATWIAAMPEKVLELQAAYGDDWAAVVRGKFFLAFTALFIPTFFSGMTFPLVVKAVSRGREKLGHDVGLLYSANTFGGVLGAIAGGYFIITLLGTHTGITFLSALLVLMGMLLIAACPGSILSKRMSLSVRAFAFLSALILFGVVWILGPADVSQALNIGYVPEDHQVIHYREGVEGTVAVTEPSGEDAGTNRVLWINRVQATTSIEKGVKMNRLQGVLPLLFKQEPREVLFMCFGSGITCGTLALSDFERIDAVEISPDVLEAAPFFETDNLGVLNRPNIEFHIDDGRNYLLTTDNRYDFITFEPMPLACVGVSTFYTQEYYQLCLDRLKPGGMVSQWVPMHSLNPDVVRSLVHTFIQVFPEYCAFFVNADLFLIGSNQPLALAPPALIETRLANPTVQEALISVGFPDVTEILASFLLDKAGLDAYAGTGDVLSDDLPWAEFVAPKLVYERTVQQTVAEIEPHVVPPFGLMDGDPASDPALAAIALRHASHKNDLDALQLYYGGMSIDDRVREGFIASLKIDPDNANAQYYLRQILSTQAEAFLGWEEAEKVETILSEALPYLGASPDLYGFLGDALKAQGKDAAAQEAYAKAGNRGE